MKTVAIVLSGCGVYDGSEIHESVISMLELKRNGANYSCFAPDKDQMHVVDHTKGEPSGETRNVLVESARIARGIIEPLSELVVSKFDAIVFPGGFGAAKNLSTWGVDGPGGEIDPDVKRVIIRCGGLGRIDLSGAHTLAEMLEQASGEAWATEDQTEARLAGQLLEAPGGLPQQIQGTFADLVFFRTRET